MQKILKHTLYIFLFIFVATALITFAGVFKLWFLDGDPSKLTYLDGFVAAVITEVTAIIIAFAKTGLKYLPEVITNKNEDETLDFMKRFIDSGSSVTIVSNRVAWLRKGHTIIEEIKEMAQAGSALEIITPLEVEEEVMTLLKASGVNFYFTNEKQAPEARFTLVNGNRSGAERLAIAKGVYPDHEITIFDNHSGPQIIAMAKDIIRKSKELANA